MNPDDVQSDPERPRARRSPAVAAALSFLWPGLGEWYAGWRERAALFAIPMAVIVLILLAWLAGGVEQAVIGLLVPAVALLFILLVVADGALRIVSMVHAGGLPDGRGAVRRPPANAVVVALGILVLVTHTWAVAVGWSLHEASNRIFEPPVARAPSSTPALPVASGSPSLSPTSGASPTPAPSNRINVLFVGVDSGRNRNHSLTDTLIVVSLDPDTGSVAMLSFPRDIARFSMSNGKVFNQKINSLMTAADKDPVKYPDGGMPTLMRELGHLLGVPIQYYAAVDLNGFPRLVDAVGGVTIDNPRAINDPTYGGWRAPGRVGFRLSAGVHHLDGETALAYARSRRGAGDSDFTRARRQQQILVALRNRLSDTAILPSLPGIIDAGSRALQTNFPQDRLDELLTLSQRVQGEDAIRRVVLGPPYAKNPPPGTPGGYQLVLDMDRLAGLSIELFGDDSRYASATR